MNSSSIPTLSIRQATLITLNVMFGSGVLINTVNLIKTAGFYGFLSYLLVACCLLPLIVAMMRLVAYYPIGGFYQYICANMSPFFGFFGAWAYVVGKLASAALLIHVFSLSLKSMLPLVHHVDPFIIDLVVLTFFTWLNYYGLKAGTAISYFFLILKLIPVFFIIFAGLYLSGSWQIAHEPFVASHLLGTIPMVLYALVGFETACSLSLTIENPHKNAPLVIFYACAISILITVAYQLIVYLTIGTELPAQATFFSVIPTIFTHFPAISTQISHVLSHLLHIIIGCAALGGSYGMIFSNAWNIYTLAANNHLIGSHYFVKKNLYGAPFYAILLEIGICLTYLICTTGNQIALQQISVFGISIAFTLSMISLLKRSIKLHNFFEIIIAVAALGSCALLGGVFVHNFSNSSFFKLAPFIIMVCCGVISYVITHGFHLLSDKNKGS